MRAAEGHPVGVQLEREAGAVGVLVVLRDHRGGARAQAHPLGVHQAMRHVLLVVLLLGRREGLFAMPHAQRHLDLADVVQHRADAEVEHVGFAEAERAAHQQRDQRDVDRVHRLLVAGRLGQQPDAEVLLAEHLLGERLGERLGLVARIVGLRQHEVADLLAGLRRFGELALAAALRGALGGQRFAALLGRFGAGARLLARCGHVDSTRRRVRSAATGVTTAGGGRTLARVLAPPTGSLARAVDGARIARAAVEEAVVALLRIPAHPLESERADRFDLLRRRDLEAVERKRVRDPAEIEVDEHADAQCMHVDQVGGRGGCSHVGSRRRGAFGSSGYRPGRCRLEWRQAR